MTAYLKSEAKPLADVLEATTAIIDGFESPLGMELLATVDWMLVREGCEPTVESVETALQSWPAGHDAARRKARLFDSRMIGLGLKRLTQDSTASHERECASL